MRTYNGYEAVYINSNIPENKLKKALKTGTISLTANELKGNKLVLLHPANAKIIKMKQSKNMGVQSMKISGGEIMADLQYHKKMGAGFNGGSLWDSIKEGASKLWDFAKKSGIASWGADQLQKMAEPFVGEDLAKIGRDTVKNVVGVGVGVGMKEKMAKVRAAKKNKVNVMKAGSFLIH